jgi:hypothetical protein
MELQHPFTCVISGPTGCGKTSLVKDILEKPPITPQNILWLYAEDQPLYHTVKNVKFHKGIPDDLEQLFDPKYSSLLIIDDLMIQGSSDPRITRLFSVGSSHRNLSIIFIVHNLFDKGKEMRTISLNTHYLIVFKNPRDNQQIATLSRQMYPGKSAFLIEAFQDATKDPYGYLLIDLKPKTPDFLRIRTSITSIPIVYIHKDMSTIPSFYL